MPCKQSVDQYLIQYQKKKIMCFNWDGCSDYGKYDYNYIFHAKILDDSVEFLNDGGTMAFLNFYEAENAASKYGVDSHEHQETLLSYDVFIDYVQKLVKKYPEIIIIVASFCLF